MTSGKDYFQTFCNLSQAFGTAATVDELLELIVKSAVEAMDAKAACLFLADKKQDVFVPKAKTGLSDQYIHANPIEAQKLVRGLKKHGHFVFQDVSKDPRLEHHDAKVAEGIASILTVGVMVDGNLIGVLSLYTADKRDFSDDDIVFMKALAVNGGIALKKARLLDRIARNASLFLQLSSAFNSSIDIKDVLRHMTETTTKAMGMKGVLLRLYDEDSNTLNVVASYGLSQKFLDKGNITGEKSIAEVLKGRTIVVEDTSKDKELQYPKETQAECIGSMVIVPVQSKEKVIGIMRFCCESPRKYPKDFIDVMKALAHTGALAIQNASMYLDLEEDKKSLEEDIWSHRLYF